MDVRVVDHPLAAARLTTLRDERTDNAAFRAALRDLNWDRPLGVEYLDPPPTTETLGWMAALRG